MPTDEATTTAENEVTSLNHNHPLYLQASDAPGVILVPIKLTGQENYALWSRSMKLALRGKGKLGFIDGSCRKTAFKGALEEQWEKCNAIDPYMPQAKKVWEDFEERFDRSDLTRIYHLWSEIATLKQGTDSVTSYYSKLKDLWAELDVMIPSPGCNCEDSTIYVRHLRSHRLLQFLMGLNKSFCSIRSNILSRKPTVTVNEAYAAAAQEENQRALGVSEKTRDPLTLLAGKPQTYNPRPKKFVPPGTICDHCGFKGHYKNDCYRLVVYPTGFQSKRKGTDGYKNDYKTAEGFRPDFKPNAHFTRNSDDFHDKGKQAEGHMTPPQYQDSVDRMQRAGTSDCVANMSGMASLNSKTSRFYEWIIDSGATHHITPNEETLNTISRVQGNSSDGVQVPTGSRCDIKGIGNAQVLEDHSFSPPLIISFAPPTECSTVPIPDPIIENTPNILTNESPSIQPSEEPLQIIDQTQSRPSRTIKPPGWLNDYVTSSKAKPPSVSCSYPISDSLQYSHCPLLIRHI
uniref:CCHC-type domain-containing protein n=1 Tax=Solanum lycopersicum TaxID=4081 RepID=A0A3Q7HKF6_SOLLC